MRFIVDESSGRALANLLKNAGYDVLFSRDVLPAADDEKILEFAEAEKRVLISDDRDFGELVFRFNKPASGVIFLRTLTTDPNKIFKMIKGILHKAEGKFIVVRENRIRVRKI